MLDETLKLYDAAVNVNSNTFNVQGADFALGRIGLPVGKAEFYTSVPTVAPYRDVTIDLELSVDNSSTRRVIARHVYKAGFKGVKVSGIGRDFNPQEYASANVDCRVNITGGTGDNANNIGVVKAYLTSGERQIAGRQSGAADTLEV